MLPLQRQKMKFDANPAYYREGGRPTAGRAEVPHDHPSTRARPEGSRRPRLRDDHRAGQGRWQADHGGQTYYFCSERCLERFRSDPTRFLTAAGKTAPIPTHTKAEVHVPDASRGASQRPGSCPKCGMALESVSVAPVTKTEWTCPMHPEIVRDQPGSCPICGMALSPARLRSRMGPILKWSTCHDGSGSVRR